MSRTVPALSFIFGKIERSELAKYQDMRKSNKQPIFIIGVPRTGSTFTYQMITNRYKVRYFDNVFDIMHQFPLAGMCYSFRYFADKPHNCFRSKNGHTLRYGLHCPSEAGNYWYRFLPRKKYQINPEDLTIEKKKNLKQELEAILTIYDEPLVIKNLANSLRLKLINELFPDARIIVIDRNDKDTSKSIRKIRKQKKTKPDEFWSIYPQELEMKSFESEDEIVENQIQSVKKIIDQDINLFPQKNILRIRYEKLMGDTKYELDRLDEFMNVNLREGAKAPAIIKK